MLTGTFTLCHTAFVPVNSSAGQPKYSADTDCDQQGALWQHHCLSRSLSLTHTHRRSWSVSVCVCVLIILGRTSSATNWHCDTHTHTQG